MSRAVPCGTRRYHCARDAECKGRDVLHPLPLRDAAQAILWIIENAEKYAIDPKRVGVLGFSAGAHLGGLLWTGALPEVGGHSDEVTMGAAADRAPDPGAKD